MNKEDIPPSQRNAAVLSLAAAVGLLAILLLSRPYGGILHDSRLYIGHALAMIDPAGVGRDMALAADGQSEFSLFPPLFTAMVRALGPSTAALISVLAALLLWGCAAAALARRLAGDGMAWAATACAFVLPATYGAYGTFTYAEAFASPRPFAEAAVMAGLALLLGGRRAWALGLFAVAAAVHPLMALGGIVAGLVILAAEDRRWLWAGGAAALAMLAAAALHLPLAGRLFEPFDPSWRGILTLRSVYLFPRLWPLGDWGRIAVQGATVAIAATFVTPRARLGCAAIGAAAAVGVAASLLFGDLWPSVLITQLQPWRALWLLTLAANLLLPVAAVGMWRGGAALRPALAALVLAWLSIDGAVPAFLLSAAAIAIFFLARAGRLPTVRPVLERLMLLATALVMLIWVLHRVTAFAVYAGAARAIGASVNISHIDSSGIPALAVTVAVVVIVLRPPRRIWPAATAALVLAGVSLTAWDVRAPMRRIVDSRQGLQQLQALTASAPGEVLWVEGDTQPWLLMGRPNWGTTIQGAGTVFSRPLAEWWLRRTQSEVVLGLADPSALTPFGAAAVNRSPARPTAAGVTAICDLPDAPAWVVLPGDAPPGLQATAIWRPPAPQFIDYVEPDAYRWVRVNAYALIRCADVIAAPPSPPPPPPPSSAAP